MKKIKCEDLNFKKVFASIVLTGIVFTSNMAFATQEKELQPLYTEDFINWQMLSEEEKNNTVMPRIHTTLTTDEVLKEYSQKHVSYRRQILTRSFSKSVSNGLIGNATYNSSTYNLKDDISVDVKHQGSTNQCWAFSMISSLETNVELNRNIQKRFSARHMDYSTAMTFTDGINELGYAREVGDGGLSTFALSYLTNGQGAVLESDMPFEDNEEQISLKELDKEVDTIVTSYVALPALYKEYAIDNGEVVYTNGGSGSSLVIYEDEEVEQFRNIIKNHIIKYGAISAVTAGNQVQFYNNENIAEATAYFCNDNSKVRDHAVTIVGWDDNYSRDNFTGAAKPYNDGAYIVINSYGTQNFDNGYMYISYEDTLIESLLYGIKSTSDVDYDKLYQYNPYGENSALGVDGSSEGYIASVYSRDISKDEVLSHIGICVPDNVSLEIYVNPNGNTTIIDGLTKVAETEVLEAGYHRIEVEPIKLTGNDFAIVVKQKSTANRFYFSIEAGLDNSIYENITGNPGKTLFSFDGYYWDSLSSQKISGLDMNRCDVCIKAFTEFKEEINISSEVYTIIDTDIYRIQHDTTLKEFKENINTNSEVLEVYDDNENKIEDDALIKTGMTLKLSEGKTYKLIVRGDTNCSGTLSLIDFSKVLANYTDETCALEGDALKAADLSCDGKISLIDISQMIVLYTSKNN